MNHYNDWETPVTSQHEKGSGRSLVISLLLGAALIIGAIIMALVSFAIQAETIIEPTRISPYEWQCQDANGQKISDRETQTLATLECINNPAGMFVQGARYLINRPTPPPPVCPAPPVSTTRTQTCPAGSTGTWPQTSASSVGPAPECAVTTVWAPAVPPAGACNRPPTLAGVPAAAVQVGAAYTFTPTAADPDGDTLAFSIANKPSWAAFDTATGRLSGTPAAANVGITSSIAITVSDGKASAATQPFSITVTAPPPAGAPANLTATFARNVTHPENTNVTLLWTAVPGVTMYEVYRCTGSTCTTFVFVQDEPAATARVLDQPPNLTAKYKVRAWKPTTGPYSAVLTVVTPVNAPTPPPTGTGTASLQWSHDGKNTDGSAGTLAGFRVLYGTASNALTSTVQVANPAATTYVVDKLASGTWFFAVRAYNTAGAESVSSNVASKVVQ